jgi:hypothetical protein
MRNDKGQFVKGHSGNPSGRPSGHSIDYYLAKALKIKDKRAIAKVVTRAATTGVWQVGEDSKPMVLNYDKWFELVQWMFERLDGKPAQQQTINLDMPTGAVHPQFVEVDMPGGAVTIPSLGGGSINN